MIAAEHLGVRAGAFSLPNISFSVPTGQYAVLMGKTGCGKTTLLETICGLKRPASGRILLMGKDMTWRTPAERNIGYVPQDGALFKTMTVRQQLGFALEIRRRPASEIRARVEELAGLLGIEPLLDRKPEGLSGGEAQRVALGRALAARPPVLCLDEPLGALDQETRVDMCNLLETVKQHTGVTVLHVTHDVQEAERLADCMLFLREGAIQTA